MIPSISEYLLSLFHHEKMGHANVSTTLGIYTHLFEKKEEEDKLASALGDMLTKSVEK